MARDNYFTPSKNIDLDKVRELASLGLDYTEIAGNLGISAKTFKRRRDEDEAIEEAIAAGRGQGVADVAAALKARAVQGDPAAQKIYLQSLGANFGKKSTVALEGQNVPMVNIRLTTASGQEVPIQ